MNSKTDDWLPSLIVARPAEGCALAVALARAAVKLTQPSGETRDHFRVSYARDPSALIAASQGVALHFQTVSAANNWWRD